MSDQEFDVLLAELVALEKKHPELADAHGPTARVGGAPSKGFVSVAHRVVMQSIDNTYDIASFREWYAKCEAALGAEHRSRFATPLVAPPLEPAPTARGSFQWRAIAQLIRRDHADADSKSTLQDCALTLRCKPNPPCMRYVYIVFHREKLRSQD